MYFTAKLFPARPGTLTSCRVARPATRRLLGFDVMDAEAPAAIAWLSARVEAGEATRVAFLNAHCANVAARDADYRAALHSADAVLPDGSGLALAARMAGGRITANLNGTDLVPALCARLAETGRSVFLLGGRPGVAEAAGAALRRACPELIVAGTHHGYFGAEGEAQLVRTINASGADVLLVAMGVPMQDSWLARMAPRLSPVLSLGVGGLFDFLSGRIPRAPRLLRRLGLEWSWRMYQEPARMWRRYVLGNPAFVLRAARAAVPGWGGLLAPVDAAVKRGLDIAGAGLGLAVLAPLLLGAALAVKLTSRGPAFLRQTRIGEDGTPFTMFKLRSMYIDAEARRAALATANVHGHAGVTFKLKRDPRITPVGRLLRKSSIDELPQLWNVLKGEMTLVGPRPQLPGEVARYAPEHFPRLAGKPGLTCLWQISGRADVPFDQQVKLDLDYLRTRNLLVDLGILLRTIPAVLAARGAY